MWFLTGRLDSAKTKENNFGWGRGGGGLKGDDRLHHVYATSPYVSADA